MGSIFIGWPALRPPMPVLMAAQELRWPTGSMSRRLARAQQLLQKRLTKRGLVLSAGGLMTEAIAQNVGMAAVPVSLMNSTLKTASRRPRCW
ncbi:MAG: hypothetical protein K2R98_14305 [Gemmataceae bacterium]|nr:hypothetical protein [Gemmataceae bacterium]